MNPSDDSNQRPMIFLIGTIVVGILVVVIAATLLRKPPSTNPFDAPAGSSEPTPSEK